MEIEFEKLPIDNGPQTNERLQIERGRLLLEGNFVHAVNYSVSESGQTTPDRGVSSRPSKGPPETG